MDVPPLVRQAEALAALRGFERSCGREVGRLLHAFAAQRGRARVAEIGTGSGVGTAWMASALAPSVPLYTAEADRDLAAAAAELFADDPKVHVLPGDWHDVLAPEAPFDLLFVDARSAKTDERAPGLLMRGGTAVLDDLTPGRPGSDPVRELWLGHEGLFAIELGVSSAEAVIVAVRVL